MEKPLLIDWSHVKQPLEILRLQNIQIHKARLEKLIPIEKIKEITELFSEAWQRYGPELFDRDPAIPLYFIELEKLIPKDANDVTRLFEEAAKELTHRSLFHSDDSVMAAMQLEREWLGKGVAARASADTFESKWELLSQFDYISAKILVQNVPLSVIQEFISEHGSSLFTKPISELVESDYRMAVDAKPSTEENTQTDFLSQFESAERMLNYERYFPKSKVFFHATVARRGGDTTWRDWLIRMPYPKLAVDTITATAKLEEALNLLASGLPQPLNSFLMLILTNAMYERGAQLATISSGKWVFTELQKELLKEFQDCNTYWREKELPMVVEAFSNAIYSAAGSEIEYCRQAVAFSSVLRAIDISLDNENANARKEVAIAIVNSLAKRYCIKIADLPYNFEIGLSGRLRGNAFRLAAITRNCFPEATSDEDRNSAIPVWEAYKKWLTSDDFYWDGSASESVQIAASSVASALIDLQNPVSVLIEFEERIFQPREGWIIKTINDYQQDAREAHPLLVGAFVIDYARQRRNSELANAMANLVGQRLITRLRHIIPVITQGLNSSHFTVLNILWYFSGLFYKEPSIWSFIAPFAEQIDDLEAFLIGLNHVFYALHIDENRPSLEIREADSKIISNRIESDWTIFANKTPKDIDNYQKIRKLFSEV
jgi:hypothetical protein